jgi:hypothetical protein
MFVKLLCFTNIFLGENNVIFDKRDHSQRNTQGYGIQHKKIQFGRQRNSLKAHKLKHSYYNMTGQGPTSLQLDFETSRQIHDTIVAWHEGVLSSQLL